LPGGIAALIGPVLGGIVAESVFGWRGLYWGVIPLTLGAGILIAKTKRYKWMYLIGYPIVTLSLFVMWRFTADSPIWLYILVTSVAAFGLGVIPTVNTLVAQFAVPGRLLGVAVGAIFFFQMIGIAVAPAILGLAQSSVPDLESGLKLVFLVGAVALTIASLLITTIPQISVDDEVPDKAAPSRLPFPMDIDTLRQLLAERDTFSILETVDLQTGERTILREFDFVISAPNWTKDGRHLIYDSRGCLYTYELATGEIGQIETGFALDCTNDHLLSPDDTQLAISHFTNVDATARIYLLPPAGGTPTLITDKGLSYLHGWSPDGKQLVYCGERDGQYDIYTIPVDGGLETQLTDEPGLDDGPEYSPSGNISGSTPFAAA
jgi:hypothetical protein